MTKKLLLCLSLAALLLASCGLSEADVQATVAVAQANAITTVHAEYTQIALLTPSATNTLPPSPTPQPSPTSGIATATLAAGAGGGATSGCDVMTFVSDVTVSDGEEIAAGSAFTKTWSLKNNGTCDWSTAYQVIFSSGDQMGGPGATPLAAAITVGSTGNVSVELIAPSASGDYTGYWAIANAAGQAFGFFSVVISVP